MAKVSLKVLGSIALFVFDCIAFEDATCAASAGTMPEAPGQSMLQTKSQRTAPDRFEVHPNRQEQPHHSISHLAQATYLSRRRKGHPPSMGSLVQLDAKGYQVVVRTCCHLEMELFIRRLVKSLGLEICDEAGLVGLLPSYASCEGEAKDLAVLTADIQARAGDATCKMVAAFGSCPPLQPGCMADPAPDSHRRRRCKSHTQGMSMGQKTQRNGHATGRNGRRRKSHTQETPVCELPAGAVWCEVRLQNLDPYFMAVYDWNVSHDWVSANICQAGFWEDVDISAFGTPGNMLDIGGNVGYHTFAFAHAGWNVTTFEPMAPNLALINATLCRNPAEAAMIHINPHGLGTANQQCQMLAPSDNVGDGFTRCGNPGEHATPGFKEIGDFAVRRLDEVLLEQSVATIDLVKIDVEGYEAQVFAGAPNFLAQYHPRLIKSELWDKMVNSSGVDYLTTFETAGYKFFTDSKCESPIDAKTEILKGGMDVIMCK